MAEITQSTAEAMFNRIGDGHANAFTPASNKSNRAFRKMVAVANENGDCIINVGYGYFRPIPGDPIDDEAFEHYIAEELHRARAIQYKRLQMKKGYERRKGICH